MNRLEKPLVVRVEPLPGARTDVAHPARRVDPLNHPVLAAEGADRWKEQRIGRGIRISHAPCGL